MSGDLERQLAPLVAPAADGDNRALQEIIRLIHPLVTRYVRARISRSQYPAPEDVIQDVCLAVATAVPNYKDHGRPFMAFVYGIASNKVIDAHRAMGRDRSHPTDEVPDTADCSMNPEDVSPSLDGSNEVRALLDLLSDRSREILVLRLFVGLSAEETAEVLDTTAGAVRVAQHRALKQLRKKFEGSTR
ncbi:sigma-70 family RNA polymerase sigma factor [Corynebacterium sp. 11A]|uniref:sigma-70 family RNA polymerase sigma factor n=1 Tax=Corynebacterium sp. 11A TaxID=2080510 RepID=UPI00124E533B|nr:sigma-70 family RNA polymerase sigma factor [Corynebacterium sp. 11A]